MKPLATFVAGLLIGWLATRYQWTREAVYHDAGRWVQFHDSDGWSWVWVWTSKQPKRSE
jgi:hypothetical protein